MIKEIRRGARLDALVKELYEAMQDASLVLHVPMPPNHVESGLPQMVDPLDAAEQAPFLLRQLLQLVPKKIQEKR